MVQKFSNHEATKLAKRLMFSLGDDALSKSHKQALESMAVCDAVGHDRAEMFAAIYEIRQMTTTLARIQTTGFPNTIAGLRAVDPDTVVMQVSFWNPETLISIFINEEQRTLIGFIVVPVESTRTS